MKEENKIRMRKAEMKHRGVRRWSRGLNRGLTRTAALLLALLLLTGAAGCAASAETEAVTEGQMEARGSWCMIYTFSAVPLWATMLIVLALSLFVPLICLRFVSGGTIQERMQTEKPQ